jgi:hypothetical protein
MALVVLVGLAVAAIHWGKRSEVRLDDWDVRDLVRYLEGQGLRLYISPTGDSGNTRFHAYLTTAANPARDLSYMPRLRQKIHLWADVVYCQRTQRSEVSEETVGAWADCGLRAGPFVFFGDPALLARIRTALGDANDSSTRSGEP